MSILLVKSPDGEIRRVELSKNQPLTIGSHSISDIQIKDPDIELMEARISWGKHQFEVTAASPKGVTVNGETVMAADLNPGDILSLGQTELIFATEETIDEILAEPDENQTSESFEIETDIGLAPLSEEFLIRPTSPPRPTSPKPSSEAEAAPSPPPASSPPPSKPKKQPTPAKPAKPPETAPRADSSASAVDDDALVEQRPMLSRISSSTSEDSADAAAPPPAPDVSVSNRIRESLHASRQRPGEKEIFRSPLVMGLSIGSFFLLVAAVVLWSLIGQEEADRYLQRAREQADQRKFQQAIDDYNTYLLEFSGAPDAEAAFRELSITRVRSQIDIGVPDWKAGLDELEELVNRHRDEDDFVQLHSQISDFAEQIAKGACEQAGRDNQQAKDSLTSAELFDISDSALRLVELYAPDEETRTRVLSEVQELRRASEAQILRRDVFDAAFVKMESALKDAKPFDLLDARLELIRRYAAAETDPRVVKLLAQALDLDKSLVKLNREEKASGEFPAGPSVPLVTLAAEARTSRDELPSGRPVYVHAADCLYGVDTATGTPLWRHVVGWDLPFFPLEISVSETALLLYSERDRELQLLSRQTGQPIWVQSLTESVVGAPLIVGTQAFVSTQSGTLLQIDLSSGTILAELSFSQPLATGPLLLPQTQHALLIGARELAYLIELNPPAVVDVLYFGHGPGSVMTSSVVTTPVRMGPLVLVAENDRSNSCRLRVFDTRQETPELQQIDEERLPGQVLDPPVIRGNKLLVPSTPERVTAFTVSAEPGESALKEVNSFQINNPRMTSSWLFAGPDGQVWMASSDVHLLHLTTKSIEVTSDRDPVGIATQPIQMLGERMYVAGRPAYGQDVRFSRLDPNDLSEKYKLSVGDRILLSTLNSSGELITLHESGSVFRIKTSELLEQPFVLSENDNVEIPVDVGSAPRSIRLADGRFVITWGGENPKLSIVRQTGQVIEKDARQLPDEPQTAPVELDAGIVVALPGRLHLVSLNGRDSTEDFPLPVVEGKTATWHSLTRLDATHLLSLEDSGLLRRIEYRTEPVLQLAEAGKLELKSRAAIPPLATGSERVLIATDGKQLLNLASDSLQIVSSRTLPSMATGAWDSGTAVFLQLQNDKLVSLEKNDDLTERWSIALAGQTVAGRPLEHNQTVFVPVAPEGIWVLNGESGELVQTIRTPGSCDGDPLVIDGRVVVPLADGSLFAIPDQSEGAAP